MPIVQLKGLKDIANKFGLKSEELKKAQEMLSITAEVSAGLSKTRESLRWLTDCGPHWYLQSVIGQYPGKVLLVTIPVRVSHSGNKHLRSEVLSSNAFSTRSNKLSYRKRDLSSVTAAASRPIIPTTGKCYESQGVCSNTTSACFGHGQCVQGRRVGNQPEGECWVCSCSSTKDDAGRTQYWSGEMCQKQDVSG